MQAALHGRFAERTMTLLWNLKTLFATYGGRDYVTGEASFDKEACDQGRLTGVRRCRFDFLANGGRICIGRANSGRTAAN